MTIVLQCVDPERGKYQALSDDPMKIQVSHNSSMEALGFLVDDLVKESLARADSRGYASVSIHKIIDIDEWLAAPSATGETK